MSKNTKALWVIVVVLLIIGGLFALWYKGGIEASTYYTDIKTGSSAFGPQLFYRGINIPIAGERIVLFKSYYSIVWKDSPADITTSVLYNKDGYNPFFMFYESGGIAAHGFCMVETLDGNGQILHNPDDVKEAEYYDPDGTKISSVKDGTGMITIYFSDGAKHYELELENYHRKSLKLWLKDGTLKLDKIYTKES